MTPEQTKTAENAIIALYASLTTLLRMGQDLSKTAKEERNASERAETLRNVAETLENFKKSAGIDGEGAGETSGGPKE